MRFCQSHWNAMRKAVEDRGMKDLVARSGKEAVENEVAALEGRKTLDNWDPLMAAHWNIANKVMSRVGLAALADDFCPLCAVQESYNVWTDENRPPEATDAQGWIDGCMDSLRAYAREQKLVADVQ